MEIFNKNLEGLELISVLLAWRKEHIALLTKKLKTKKKNEKRPKGRFLIKISSIISLINVSQQNISTLTISPSPHYTKLLGTREN